MSHTFTFPIRSDKLTMTVAVRRELCDVQSEFQRIQVLETEAFGKMLLLDGHIQLTELDERVYHEALVHPPLLSALAPTRALVIGGGDGGVVRELCRHASLKAIDMVEIDQAVIDVCKLHLPEVNAGRFEDPRVTVHVADAFPFVKSASEPYDLIVMDSTDTYEGEDGALSEQLFTESFYRDCARILTRNGFLITQADNLMFCPYSLEAIQSMFQQVFAKVGSYFAVVPSFGGYSGYCWASHGGELAKNLSPAAGELNLKTLTPEAYAFGMAGLPA